MNDTIKVLAVDDAVANLAVIKACLRGGNFELITATNAIDALKLFKEQFFDVLLLDVVMPGVTGFELRKLIRKIDAERPIIFFTSMVEDGSMTLMNELSWDIHTSYLHKKTNRETLVKKIADVTAVYRKWTAEKLHSKKMEDELELAGNLQKRFLPKWCILNDKMLCSAVYLPLMRVSGDIYQVYELPDGRQLFFLGDISGHGIAAALYMTAIQAVISRKIKAEPGISAGMLLSEINEFICGDIGSTIYMTALVAIFDFENNTVETLNAGYWPLLQISASGMVTAMDGEVSGFPLGWFGDAEYNEKSAVVSRFVDDDIFLGFTDGLLELEGKAGLCVAGEEINAILKEIVVQKNTELAVFPHRVIEMLKSDGYTQLDDITIVAIQKRRKIPKFAERLIPAELVMVDKTAAEFSKFTDDMMQAIQIELCLHEHLNNIIVHGGKQQHGKSAAPIYVNIREKDEQFIIYVADTVKPWDITGQHEKSDIKEFKEDYTPTSGRGIEILHNTTESIDYNSCAGVNECKFVMKKSGGV